ncbi:hypothetical protein LguiA_036633 [Lonicera macranthoides]
MNGLCKSDDLEKADWLVRDMLYRGPSPSCVIYNTLMKGDCASLDQEWLNWAGLQVGLGAE